MYFKRWLPASVFTVTAVIGAGLLACTEKEAGLTDPSQSTNRAVTETSTQARKRYTKAELHSRNPLDWFGKAHNHVANLMIEELRKPDVTYKTLCARMKEVLRDPKALAPFASRLSEPSDSEMLQTLSDSPICDKNFRFLGMVPGRDVHNVAFAPLTDEPGPVAQALYDDILAESEAATDTADLADRLSPIVDAAEQLTGDDSMFVLVSVAVAQHSFEYWSETDASQVLIDDIYDTEVAPCYMGQYEDAIFEADGDTFQCHNSEWRQIRWQRSKSTAPTIHLASFSPRSTVANCGQDGYNYRWGWVTRGDLGALGIAGLFAKATGPSPWYLAGITAVSVGAGGIEAYRWIRCNVF
jgi:hypothetical protein